MRYGTIAVVVVVVVLIAAGSSAELRTDLGDGTAA